MFAFCALENRSNEISLLRESKNGGIIFEMLTFTEPTLQGVNRAQYPNVYQGIDELKVCTLFPDGCCLSLIPGETDFLEVKLIVNGQSRRGVLKEESASEVVAIVHRFFREIEETKIPTVFNEVDGPTS